MSLETAPETREIIAGIDILALADEVIALKKESRVNGVTLNSQVWMKERLKAKQISLAHIQEIIGKVNAIVSEHMFTQKVDPKEDNKVDVEITRTTSGIPNGPKIISSSDAIDQWQRENDR